MSISPRSRRLLLGAVALLTAACNTLITPSLPEGQVPTLTTLSTDGAVTQDEDIAPRLLQNLARPKLQQELLRQDGPRKIFRAVQWQRTSRTPARRGPLEVRGEFRYYDHLGNVLPGANATVALFRDRQMVGSTRTDANGQWQLDAPANGQYHLQFSLENPLWKINEYSWEGQAFTVQGATDTGVYTLEKGTQNAEVSYIHEIYNRALRLFEREGIDIKWWKRQIGTEWPNNANYYSYYTVHLSGTQQWDVNGHEIGHAIYAQALNARSTGGQHKIDECYDGTLALSEGFATFFSGLVNLERQDSDAKFGPYLVPRRAPIRIENTPADVCQGNRNEWRVSSVLWDLYDTVADGPDQLALPLKDIWAAFSQPNKPAMRNALDAYTLLKEKLPSEQHPALREVFLFNTMEIAPQ